jgi:hypothetical protein
MLQVDVLVAIMILFAFFACGYDSCGVELKNPKFFLKLRG